MGGEEIVERGDGAAPGISIPVVFSHLATGFGIDSGRWGSMGAWQ
jgi:hypothetical protein